ncbi:RlmE family RNA methyltransferase [Thermodesulfobacteriota bacterium]
MAKKKSTKSWLKAHTSDKYVKLSKKEDLKSRAAFKLKQINEKYKLLKEGSSVIDLGAAPGGWSQIAERIVKDSGLVIAIDILDISITPKVNVIKGDILSDQVRERTEEILRDHNISKVNLVMSDMAPNLTGIASTDSARGYELNKMALTYAGQYLKKGGGFIAKLFRNDYFDDFVKETKKVFKTTAIYKPDASRQKSSEIYLIAKL